jgi:uncharacterized protein with GYD domain
MPRYLIRASYTPATWANLIRNPEDRAEGVSKLAQSVGGRLESLYFAFGEDDVYVIIEAPDNVTAAALSLAASSSGSFSRFSTTVLMTSAEAKEAMQKAGTIPYAKPGG